MPAFVQSSPLAVVVFLGALAAGASSAALVEAPGLLLVARSTEAGASEDG